MRHDEFRAACSLLWGGPDSWGAEAAAEHLQVNARNVYYWAAGRKPVPHGVAAELGSEMHRRLLDPADATPGLEFIRTALAEVEGNKAA